MFSVGCIYAILTDSQLRRNYIEMFNTKLLTYDITVPTYIRDKTRKIKHKNKIVLGVIIANLEIGRAHV